MNKWIGVGRLGKDPDQRTTAKGTEVTSFSMAVDRKFKNENGEKMVDWINCVAFGKTAIFIAKYFKRGSSIGITGSLQSRTYDDANGVRKYVTEVLADDVEFVTSKAQKENQPTEDLFDGDFQPLDDAEVPF